MDAEDSGTTRNSDVGNVNLSEPLSEDMLLTGRVDPRDLSYTPPLNKKEKQEIEDKKKSSDFQGFINMAKLCFGNAYLSIPNVFSITGIIGGILLFAVVGTLNIYTMQQNLDVAEKHPRLHSYSQLGHKLYGKWGKLAVDISIWIMQLSVCISYIYFIAQQLDEQFCYYNGYCGNENLWMLVLTVPALAISMFETFTFLAYLSMFGITIALIGMISMFGYCGHQIVQGVSVTTPIKWFSFKGVIGHIGVAMFVFEGNAAVLNVRAEAKHQDHFPCVLKSGVSFAIILFMIFATVGYCTYRDTTDPIFTLSLQPINGFVSFIIACVCLNAFMSYPLQILAAFDIIEQATWLKEGRFARCKRIGVRTVIILLVTGISMLIPNFTDFLNIAGSLGAALIAFVLPPIFYNKQFEATITPCLKYSNWGIVAFGVIGGALSITTSIIDMTNGSDE